MSNNNNKQLGEAPWLHVMISTGLGTGFVPKAPGTAGAFLALLIWIGLYYVLSPIGLLVATILLVVGSLLIGVWTDNVMEKYWGEDPRSVVIDEFFGTWVAALAVVCVDGSAYVSISLATIGFVLHMISDSRPDIKVIVLDDINYLLSNETFENATTKGYEKFTLMAKNYYDLLADCQLLRDDLTIVVISHTENFGTDLDPQYRLWTTGKMLTNQINLDGMFSYIIYSERIVDDVDGEVHYRFKTRTDGNDTCRSVAGCFDEKYIEHLDKPVLKQQSVFDVPFTTKISSIEPKKEAPRRPSRYRKSDVVIHKIFGEGVVVKCDGDFVTVAFSYPHGTKTIKADHPSIRKKSANDYN